MIIALVMGFLIGFIGSIPVAGPVAAIILRSAIDGRLREARAIAFGSAFAESLYAAMAFWGMSAAMARFPVLVPVSRAAGAFIVAAVGLHFALSKKNPRTPADDPAGSENPVGQRRRGVLLGITITALNPTLIATWTAAVTVLHSTGIVPETSTTSIPFALGAFAGIVGWLSLLVSLVQRFRERVSAQTLGRVVRGTGWFLLALGITLGVRTLVKML